jgi:hypothetical protein
LTNKRECLIKIIGYNSNGKKVVSGRTRSLFTIEVVRVISPSRREVLTSDTTYTIMWQKNGTKNPVDKIRLSYSKDGGSTWYPITSLPGNTVSFDWLVPIVKVKKPNCKIRVVLKDVYEKTVGSDVSDGNFIISPA